MITALPADIRPRVGQFLRLLSSDRDGEVLAAARALVRVLKNSGADLHDLADAVERSPNPVAPPPVLPRAFAGRSDELPSPYRLIDYLAGRLGSPVLSRWESDFVGSIVDNLRRPRWRLSERQAEVVNSVIMKLAEVEQ